MRIIHWLAATLTVLFTLAVAGVAGFTVAAIGGTIILDFIDHGEYVATSIATLVTLFLLGGLGWMVIKVISMVRGSL